MQAFQEILAKFLRWRFIVLGGDNKIGEDVAGANQNGDIVTTGFQSMLAHLIQNGFEDMSKTDQARKAKCAGTSFDRVDSAKRCVEDFVIRFATL